MLTWNRYDDKIRQKQSTLESFTKYQNIVIISKIN